MTAIYRYAAFGILALVALGGCGRSPESKRTYYLESGKKFVARKDYARAILEFRNAAQAVPADPDPYYQLGMAYLASRDIPRAVAAFRKASEVDPKHVASQLRVAQLMAATVDPKVLAEAEGRLKGILQSHPANQEALNALALTELKLGKTDRAVEHLEEILATAPASLGASVLLAKTHMGQKNAAAAEQILKKACESAPQSTEPVMVLARFYGSLGKADLAEEQFRKALRMSPASGTALLELARLQNQVGRKQEAEQSFKRLAAFSDPGYRPVYAMFLFDSGRHTEAVREFERLAREDPDDRMARTRLVAVYQATGRPLDAEKLLNQALAKNPKDLDALLQRGELFMAAKKYGQAETDLNVVLRQRPASAELHYIMAKLHQARGAALTYRQELSDALKLNPYLLTVRLELAQALLAGNGAKSAREILNEAPEIQKQSSEYVTLRNWVLWSLGELAELRKGIDQGLAQQRSTDLLIQDGLLKLRQGSFAAARTTLEEALKIDPEDLRALEGLRRTYVAQKQAPLAMQKVREYASRQAKSAPVQQFLGNLLLADGQQARARSAFAAAVEADPVFIPAYLSLAQMDAAENRWDRTRESLSRVLALDRGNGIAHLWMGIVEQVQGNPQKAAEKYREALQADPNNSKALNNLAWVLAENLNRSDEALKYAERALELAPNDAAKADTLGWILYKKGLYQQAVRHLGFAASSNAAGVPRAEFATWQYHLAMACAKSGDLKRGRSVLEMALKMAPALPEAKLAQALIGKAN